MTRKRNRGVTKYPVIIFTGIMILDQVRSTTAFCIGSLAPKEGRELKRSKMCLHLDCISICSLFESINFVSCLFTVPVHLIALSTFS